MFAELSLLYIIDYEIKGGAVYENNSFKAGGSQSA